MNCKEPTNFATVTSGNTYIPKERLKGKVAVVTGSTTGIGFAIAKRLAQEGATVIISSRQQDNVDKAVLEMKSLNLDVTGLVCHVSKAEDRKRVFDQAQKFGGVDILVSNAAVNPSPGPLLESTVEVWDKIFDVNLKANFLLAQEAVPIFRKKGGGNIVFISSSIVYSTLFSLGTAAYYVSKTALLGLTKALAVETASDNIRVNCVCPGLISTKFAQHIIQDQASLDLYLKMSPQGRVGEPEDISGVVAFLVTDDAKYITGESIPVAGGGFSRL